MSGVIVKVFPNTYRDSIQLLKVASDLQKLHGVKQASMMMGTPSNKKMMEDAVVKAGGDRGTVGQELSEAAPGDLVLTIVAENLEDAQNALTKSADLLDPKASSGQKDKKEEEITTITDAIQRIQDQENAKANLAIISVPGDYAATEAHKALSQGLHVLLFSDNVSVEDEKWLKDYANNKNLLLMGPDCGTAMIDRVPLGFANVINEGSIGLVGASGTGLQQVSSLIDQLGEGVTQIIGVGGHDLSDKVGGTMMLQAITRLEDDPSTSVIVLVSKPPSPTVATKILNLVKKGKKPYVIMFLGMERDVEWEKHAAVADTLEDAALLSVGFVQGKIPTLSPPPSNPVPSTIPGKDKKIKGLFCGGTFNTEAKIFLEKFVGKEKFSVIDLGDDEYTVGRPHPMIDYTLRNEYIIKAVDEEDTGAILLDIVLGYGGHENPSEAIAPALTYAKQKGIPVFAHVCGTENDQQKLSEQIKKLNELGAILYSTNAQTIRGIAGYIKGQKITDPQLQIPKIWKNKKSNLQSTQPSILISNQQHIINIGLPQFTVGPQKHGAFIQHVNWKPPAGGDAKIGRLISIISDANNDITLKINQANKLAVDKIINAHPVLKDVIPAKEAMPGLANPNKKIILHSGPPIEFERMCGPMQGAVTGAIVFEGWAKTLEEAIQLAQSGEIHFSPCHEFGAVGPMAGVTSPSMPVFVVENTKEGNVAFSNLNEGLGKVLRFGANDTNVVNKLLWMKNVLGPVLHKALNKLSQPIDLKAIIMQALQMGDECHNRNAASTLIFAQQIVPTLWGLGQDGVSAEHIEEVLKFVYGNAHFFLNMSMASCKATLDAGANIPYSTIATVMCRNGVDFGLRLSGTGNQWFVTPSPKVHGLLFPGFTMDDANPDMGDSSITETAGIGGFAMAAAPAITGFVGGSASDAVGYTNEMYKICERRHPDFKIPSLDYAGLAVGIDARLVAETGVLPVINTGIAHKKAGVGQIGAGVTRAPMKCFVSALNQFEANYVTKRHYSTHIYRRFGTSFGRSAALYGPNVLRMLKRK